MKKLFSILTIVAGAALLVLSCGKQEVDTNQFPATSEVVLKAYGPLPVVRGGVLRFVGMNLDQVASVTIPGCDPITDIEVVSSGVPSEIHVTVPKNEAEVGTVILTTKSGKTIETATPLSYIETIVLDKITPEEAYPGEVITIEGDYLHFIHEVVFPNKVYVSEKDFVSHDRYSIKVNVPEEARSGRLGIGTIDETVETDEDVLAALNVLEAPFVVKTAEGTVSGEYKAGATVTINGTKLSLVKSLELTGATVTDFTATDSKITFTLPAEASDGDVFMVMASGAEVSAGSITTTVPTELVASPEVIKNGNDLTVTGKDIDLVTGVELPNAGWVDFTNDGKIVFNVPEAAQAGDVTLHLANGKSVTVPYALVEPVITGFSANPAAAGSDVTIEGTDLDLVKSVTFGGGITVDVTATETAITVAVPTAAETGELTLNLKNGASVEGLELAIDKPAGAYIAALPVDPINAGEMLIIDIENAGHLTGVQFDGADVTYILNGSTLYVQIPLESQADTAITLVSDNGSVTYNLAVIPATSMTKVVFVGPISIDWGDNRVYIEDAMMEGVPENAVMHIEFTQHEAWGQVQINYADWSQIPFAGTADGYIKTDTINDKSVTEIDLPLTAEILANIKQKSQEKNEGHSIIIQGSDWTINKISFNWEISLEKDLAEFVNNTGGTPITYPYTFTWGDDGRFVLPQSLLLDELKVKKGSKFLVYKDKSVTGQVQINNSSWEAIYSLTDWNAEFDVLELEFDDTIMDAVNNGGLIIQGALSGITKIAILP